jgi:long-chain acyl-CoA synthetase
VFADSGADVLVVDAAFLAEAKPALVAAGLARDRVLVAGDADGWASFDAAVAAAPETAPAGAVAPGAYNIIIYTSGTTGRPKGVVHPSIDPKVGFEAQKGLVDMWGFRADDVHLMVGPAYHTMPSAYVVQHLFVGATAVLMRKFDAEECLRLISTERVTTTAMVPAHFIRILELPDAVRARYDLSSLRKVLHAAAPCPPDVKRRIMRVFPEGSVWEFYGATEGPGTIISPAEWLDRPGSVGQPWPGVVVKILDDQGHECSPGAVGTIYLSSRGGARFRYHNAAEKTAAAFRGDFFTVGDVGWVDDEGYLFISDRKHDMVISGGVNIYPLEIENVLAGHPDVVDVAVVGVPDPRWGEALVAVVERRPGSALAADALTSWTRERIADYKVPRRIEFVAELPRDPNGKVVKRLLRERFGAPPPERAS